VRCWAWRVKLSLSLERDLFTRCVKIAEKVAIRCLPTTCARLLAAPAGPRGDGLDLAYSHWREGGGGHDRQLVETATVFPHEPRKDWDGLLHRSPSSVKNSVRR
jgi:uncharacterized protein